MFTSITDKLQTENETHHWRQLIHSQIQTTFRSSPHNKQTKTLLCQREKGSLICSCLQFNESSLEKCSSLYLERFAIKFGEVRKCALQFGFSLPEKAKIAFCEKTFWFSLLIMFFESSRDWSIRSSRPSIREFSRFAFRVPLSNEQSFSMVPLPMGRRSFSLRQKQNEQQTKQWFPCKGNDHFDQAILQESNKRIHSTVHRACCQKSFPRTFTRIELFDHEEFFDNFSLIVRKKFILIETLKFRW